MRAAARGGINMTLKELAVQQSIYESDKYCHVCHGKLEDAHYAGYNDYFGMSDEMWSIKTNSGNHKLKRCTRCGLLYAK